MVWWWTHADNLINSKTFFSPQLNIFPTVHSLEWVSLKSSHFKLSACKINIQQLCYDQWLRLIAKSKQTLIVLAHYLMHSGLATAVIRLSLLPEIDYKHHLLHLWRFCTLNVGCVRRSCQYSGVWLLLGDKGECSAAVKCKIACQGRGAGKEVLCTITTTFSWWLGRDAETNVECLSAQ